MRRLARTGLVRPVRRGIWALGDRPDPLVLGDYITAPYPSYVSLQTSLTSGVALECRRTPCPRAGQGLRNQPHSRDAASRGARACPFPPTSALGPSATHQRG